MAKKKSQPKKQWYSARLLIESVNDARPRGETLFEETVIVFRFAEDCETKDLIARVKALAREREDEYVAIAGNRVKWVFREILEIQDISGAMKDGTEVYFRWWHDPGPRAFELMRRTHEHPWWPAGKGHYERPKPRPKRSARPG